MAGVMENNKRKTQFVSQIKGHFYSDGWTIDETPGSLGFQSVKLSFDFVAKKESLQLAVRYIDQEIVRFFSLTNLITKFDAQTREMRRNAAAILVYVVADSFTGFDRIQLSSRGIVIIFLSEIHLLTEIDRGIPSALSEIDPRKTIIYQNNTSYCLMLADKERLRGNLDCAIEWARLAFSARTNVGPSHRTLFELLYEKELFDEAEIVALDALEFQRQNVEFLRKVRRIAVKNKDSKKISLYDNKIEIATTSLPTAANKKFLDQQGNSLNHGTTNYSELEPSISFLTKILRNFIRPG